MRIDKHSFIKDELENRKDQNLLRRLRTVEPLSEVEIIIEGRKMINFSSNDYLGFSKHPVLKAKATEYVQKYGTGSTASRLICGTLPYFEPVEEKLAKLKKVEKTLIFNSGFQTNISILPVLTDKNSLILSDRLNHNSLIQGALLSNCRILRYKHNDHKHLKKLLIENKDKGFSRILIVTESVFSMDGDQSDIDSLSKLSDDFGAFLVIDEAHATGVLGAQGMGLTCGKNVDLVIGTFGKACGSFGAYVATSKNIREYLINCCSGFVYSTALPPSTVGAIDAALDLIPTLEKDRRKLLQKAQFLRTSLNNLGWDTGKSTTQIIPVIVGEEQKTLELSDFLEENGILAVPIRPPSVPKGRSRIRLTLTAAHTWDHIEKLVSIFNNFGKQSGS